MDDKHPHNTEKSPTLTAMVGGSPPAAATKKFPRDTLIITVILGALFCLANYWQFVPLVQSWYDPNWSHGFIIPLFSLYLLYARRHELATTPRRVCLWGLPVLILAIVIQILAYYPIQTYWFSRLGIILMLLGLVWYLAGTQFLRITWLPIVYLFFAIPIPKRIYDMLAVPLQELAAAGSAVILRLFGVTIHVTASHLDVLSVSGVWRSLDVIEACSGIRSLMAFVALGVAMAYLAERPVWQRIVLVVATIPVAVACNVLRVAITAGAFVLDKPQWGQKFMHEFTGLLMLIPAAILLWLLAWLLKHLYVEVDEEDEADGGQVVASENAS